jgi:hypothetical protein
MGAAVEAAMAEMEIERGRELIACLARQSQQLAALPNLDELKRKTTHRATIRRDGEVEVAISRPRGVLAFILSRGQRRQQEEELGEAFLKQLTTQQRPAQILRQYVDAMREALKKASARPAQVPATDALEDGAGRPTSKPAVTASPASAYPPS